MKNSKNIRVKPEIERLLIECQILIWKENWKENLNEIQELLKRILDILQNELENQ